MTNAERIVDLEEDSSVDDSVDSLGHYTVEKAEIMPRGHLTGHDPSSEVERELQEAQVQDAINNIPAKFQGKKFEDVVDMYTNLEKELGRKGQEVGELRKITDQILQSQFANTQERQEPEEKPDFFDDPERAVKAVIERELAPLRQEKEKSRQQQFQANLQNTFPDYEQILSSPDFAEYIQASPYRLKMYQDADNWNWEAANELLSAYKLTKKQTAAPTPELDLPNLDEPKRELTPEERAKRDADLRAASVEKGSTGETTRKVFRRADLGRLLQTDPERYYALEPEIRKAYREGRVR